MPSPMPALLLTVVLCLGACGSETGESVAEPAAATGVTPSPSVVRTEESTGPEDADAVRSTLRRDLRNAVTAIESWSVDGGGRYTGLTTAKLNSDAIGFRSPAGVAVTVDPSVTAASYCLEAVSAALPDEVWRYRGGEKWSYTKSSPGEFDAVPGRC